jgi:hypothetical protein
MFAENLDEVNRLTRGEMGMVAANPNYRFVSTGSNPMPPVDRLAERVRHYLDQHPEVSREEFLLEAVQREIHFREQKETRHRPEPERQERRGTGLGSSARPRLSAEDIRIHAWLIERLAVLHHERHGLWPRLRRFLFGNRLVLRLGFPHRQW